MLDTGNIELYTKLLSPPDGYKTEQALCVTYSLDLTMLLSASVSLFMGREINGTAEKERYDVLAALQEVKNKLRLYCQAGQIHVPQHFNRLYQLIEPTICMIPVVEGSFHPKLWLIKYKTQKEQSREEIYRLIVLSRNLTDSRDWDISFYSDGKVDPSFNGNKNLIKFIKNLSVKKDPIASGFQKKLSKIRWDIPEGVSKWDFFGLPSKELPFPNEISRLLIISPFVRSRRLEFLSQNVLGETYLFSRQDELDRISKSILEKYKCYVLKDAIIDGETLLDEDITFRKKNGLHSKVYLWENSDDIKNVEAFIGSANCTNAAFKYNTETMIHLKYNTSLFDDVIENLIGNIEDKTSEIRIFQPYTRQEPIEQVEDEKKLKELKKDITLSIDKVLIMKVNNSYEMCVYLTQEISIPQGYSVFISPLTKKSSFMKIKYPEILFNLLSIDELTSFFIFEIRNNNSPSVSFLMRLETDINAEIIAEREQSLMHTIFSSMNKLLTYLAFLLEDETFNDTIEINISGSGNYSSGGGDVIYEAIPLYERLLLIAAENPLQLKKIDNAIQMLKSNDQIEQDKFQNLLDFWEPFRTFIPGDR